MMQAARPFAARGSRHRCACAVEAQPQPTKAAGGASPPLLHEQVDDGVAAILVVEEHEQRPVHEPDALLQLDQQRRKGVGVDHVLQDGQTVGCMDWRCSAVQFFDSTTQ